MWNKASKCRNGGSAQNFAEIAEDFEIIFKAYYKIMCLKRKIYLIVFSYFFMYKGPTLY